MIRVGIVDDHPVFRLGLRRSLEREPELSVVWEVGSVTELWPALELNGVDVILMDLNLGPDQDALAATRTLMTEQANVKVVIISASLDWEVAAASRNAGASGYLPKDLGIEDMVAAIRTLATPNFGRSSIADLLNLRVANKGESWITRVRLSSREREVLGEMRRGRTNREIAARFGISVTTINKHVQHVLKKLNVRTRGQAVAKLHAEATGSTYVSVSRDDGKNSSPPATPGAIR